MVIIRKNLGITFDDVLLVPKKTSLKSRSQVDLKTRLTPKIKLANPIISANMDTITEADMAIEMARAGGIGIIHRFLPIKTQAKEVMRVKRAEHYLIEDPITVGPETTLRQIKNVMKKHKVTSVLVVDTKKTLQGLLTKRDIRFEIGNKTSVKKLMTPKEKLIVSGPKTTLEQAKAIMHKHRIEKIPLVTRNGKLVGLITENDILHMITRPHATKDSKGKLRVGAAVGIKPDALERTQALVEAGADVIVIDVAHGHSTHLIKTLKNIKKKFKKIEIIAGNVATYKAAKELINAGADAIKVGIGPGALCTTRVVAGAGIPQITAITEAAKATKSHKLPIIADGGIRTSGDIVKALAAGASTVMIGTLFAGCKESSSPVIFKGSEKYKITRGMASLKAYVNRPDTNNNVSSELREYTAEGVEAIVHYKGDVADTVSQLLGGIKSGFSYCGAKNLSELWKRAEFVKISHSALVESRPHDVDVL